MVPGGGPSLSDEGWIESRHPKHRRRRKPYLVDNRLLSTRFRDLFLAGLKKLRDNGALHWPSEHASHDGSPKLEDLLSKLALCDWCVFIQGPPRRKTSPEQVLKYLARYLTGGPISDRRLLSREQGQVTFLARRLDKPAAGRRAGQAPFTLDGLEFVRRWSLHILPKGFTKVRYYGGYSNRQAESYGKRCRELLGVSTCSDDASANKPETDDEPSDTSTVCCPTCGQPLTCLLETSRPSWWDVMTSEARPSWYHPFRPRDG